MKHNSILNCLVILENHTHTQNQKYLLIKCFFKDLHAIDQDLDWAVVDVFVAFVSILKIGSEG